MIVSNSVLIHTKNGFSEKIISSQYFLVNTMAILKFKVYKISLRNIMS